MFRKFNVFLLVAMLLMQSTCVPACAAAAGREHSELTPDSYRESSAYAYVGSVATTPAGLKANPGDILRQFVSDSPYDGLYCSVSGNTVRTFDDIEEITADPFFKNGGYTMGVTEGKLQAYVICVDFEDCVGAERVEYGDLQNVFYTEGQEYDYSKPETYYKTIFQGSDGFKEAKEWTGEKEYHGIIKYFEELSYGKMDFDVTFVNSMVPNEDGSWPWFRLPGEQRDWSIQYSSGVEDYRIFARLHQGAVDAAYKYVPDLDMEDIGFLYVVTPVNTFGFREGLQGGAGIDTAFSYQDQSLILRDTEMRHQPGVTTKGGRMIGSSTTITKGARGYDGADRSYFRVMAHETGHGLGLTDDYTYEGRDHVSDEEAQRSWGNPVGNWGIMAGMTADTPDWPAWYKFKANWIDDDEIEVILPGETREVFVSALGSKEGKYDQGSKMVLIPTEWRTTNTFANKVWNPNGTDYNFFDWFTPVWVGGEQYGWKSFPTGFVLESRRAVGPDYANDSGRPGTQGVLVTQLSDLTWETGHGAAGLKVMYNPESNLNAPCIGAGNYAGLNGDTIWEDTSRGVKVEVVESNEYGDRVRITYSGKGSGVDRDKNYVDVKRAYQGELTISDSYAVAGDTVEMDFDLFTFGKSADTGMKLSSKNPAPVIVREGSPLGVPGGVAGYTMTVSYDPNALEYVGISEDSGFKIDAELSAGTVTMSAISGKMLRDELMSLNFKVKDGVSAGEYRIEAAISDVTLLDYNGNAVDKSLYATKVDKAVGRVTVNDEPTYTVSGKITESRQGDIGVPATVTLHNKNGAWTAETKSLNNGQYSIPNVPAGDGYYIVADKHLYDETSSETFAVKEDKDGVDVQLKLSTVTISGYVFGDSEDNPLKGSRVQIVDDGFMPAGSEAVTDENGYYEVTDVPVMEKEYYTVTSSAEGYGNGYGPNYGMSMDDLFSAVEDLQNMNITLNTTYKVKGKIYPYDEDAGYQVQLLQDGKLVGEPVKGEITESDYGRAVEFTIDNVPPGQNYALEVSGSGYLNNRSTPFEILTSNVLRKELKLLNKDEAVALCGKVTDVSGNPLTGVSVGSEDVVLGNVVGEVVTDEKGEYTLYLPKNAELNLYFSRSGYKYSSKTVVTENVASSLNMAMARQSSGGSGSSAVPTYTVKFDTGGGSAVSSVKAEKNVKIDEPKAPTRAGYTFVGWYTDKALTKSFDFDTAITGNITLYAKWTQEETKLTEPAEAEDTATLPAKTVSFADVSGHWALEAISYVFEKGLMTGTGENTFSPDSAVSRGMIVTILHRLENYPAAAGHNFTDVRADDWYSDAVAWAAANKIVNGYDGSKFGPQDSIVREQLVTILYRYAQFRGYLVDATSDLKQYSDSGSVSSWAEAAMEWAVGAGLIQGRDGARLAPDDSVTRAEIAVILMRFIENIGK